MEEKNLSLRKQFCIAAQERERGNEAITSVEWISFEFQASKILGFN